MASTPCSPDDRPSRSSGQSAPPNAEGDDPVLPRSTMDETDLGWGEDRGGTASGDERLIRERPPHWE
jgi:hypothetical protein